MTPKAVKAAYGAAHRAAPCCGDGVSGDDLTRVALRFTTDLRARVGQNEVEFAYKGNTLRELMKAIADQFDVADLLIAGEELRPYVQVVINGRFSYTVGGLEAEIPDGASVVLFACRGVLTPVALPAGTTLSDLRDEGT